MGWWISPMSHSMQAFILRLLTLAHIRETDTSLIKRTTSQRHVCLANWCSTLSPEWSIKDLLEHPLGTPINHPNPRHAFDRPNRAVIQNWAVCWKRIERVCMLMKKRCLSYGCQFGIPWKDWFFLCLLRRPTWNFTPADINADYICSEYLWGRETLHRRIPASYMAINAWVQSHLHNSDFPT